MNLIVWPIRKAIDPLVRRVFNFVETFKETTIHKRNVCQQADKCIRILEQITIAIERMNHEMLTIGTEAPFAHFLIERGKKEIL